MRNTGRPFHSSHLRGKGWSAIPGVPGSGRELTETPNPHGSNVRKDGEALFLRASVWREFAEHVAGSLTKGSRVIAQGRLKQRSYETKEGEKRTSIELEIDEIGPSLRYATAQVTRTQSSRGPGGGFGGGAPAVEEPWAASAPADPSAGAPDAGGWAAAQPGAYNDETPF
ncbi:single-stranded DNA-binding protein [Leifsonia sp. McL0607]|uniref:single-stranded DNA-binding protein n=1 Tax=Leifsonia sp. McL0607 TaxID=3415672 RepID=UPI003CF287F3